MKTIVFAGTKGGIMKTTLAYNVALMAAQKHQVFMADMDPQGSLKAILDRRNEMINPRLIHSIENLAQTARLLSQAGYDRPFMFVDTPGSLMHIITDALSAADLIVLPAQPSKLDLEAQEAIAARVERMGLRDRTMFVLTRTSVKAETEKALAYLRSGTIRSPYPILTIGDRVDYQRGVETGQAAWEVGKKAEIKKEIGALWQAIQAALKQPTVTETKTDEQRVH
jgi:chromosome partitioning protein